MTRSLFTVEDVDGGYVHYSHRNRDELLGEWIPGTVVVEYGWHEAADAVREAAP